jgi:3-oxoacyl-[acyl-carrier-protein] synthase II
MTTERIYITGADTVTVLGDTSETLWQNLLAGKSGIKAVRHFSTDTYVSRYGACIANLLPPGGATGLTRAQALLNRLLSATTPVPADTVLITATTKAGIENIEPICRARPVADERIIAPSAMPERIAAALGLTKPGINVSAACASSTIALARAAAMIAGGRAPAALVCSLDVVTDFVFSGFSALQALSPFPCKPFDRNRRGLTLGEGAAAILLMNARRAEETGRRTLGEIVGWGAGNDAAHITAPARDGSGLILAVNKALKRAGFDAARIDAVSAHGTGTIYNDAMELTAFRQLFGARRPPLYSIKGAIGHTLGSAGAIEVAAGLHALANRIAPPTIGLEDPDDGAAGWVRSGPVRFEGDYLLTTNSGFGGVNAALILKSGDR